MADPKKRPDVRTEWHDDPHHGGHWDGRAERLDAPGKFTRIHLDYKYRDRSELGRERAREAIRSKIEQAQKLGPRLPPPVVGETVATYADRWIKSREGTVKSVRD